MECEEPFQLPEMPIRLPPFQPVTIPSELHSVYEGGPFRTCSICSGDLGDGRSYEVQKVMRGKECIFEMAVCRECGTAVARECSEESLEAMKGFLLCNFKPTREPLHCHFCGFPRSMFESYSIIGACAQESLILPAILMCERCSDALQERLSRKTRETQEDFIRDCFPGVPADLDLAPTFGGVF